MKKTLLICILFFAFMNLWHCPPVFPEDTYKRKEAEYLIHKFSGDYAQALEDISRMMTAINDPVLMEVSLFRLHEIVIYPELLDRAIEICRSLSGTGSLIVKHYHLQARLKLILLELCIRKGDLNSADNIRRELSFVSNYQIIGPFRSRSVREFNESLSPEKEFRPDKVYQGKTQAINWWRAGTDLLGILDISDRDLEQSDSIYYLRKEISVEKTGTYSIILGKTGYTDLWIDGKPVFRNRNKHSFCEDQYWIKANLKEGKHVLLIKTGDSYPDGIKISVRIVPEVSAEGDFHTQDKNVKADNKQMYFPALSGALKQHSTSEDGSFYTGYLIYSAGLNSIRNREAEKYFSTAMNSERYGMPALYYTGLCERGDLNRELYFRKAASKSGCAMEPLERIAWIKLKNNFIHEAYPLIQKIKSGNPSSVIGDVLLAEYFRLRGWYEEAIKTADRIEKTSFPSAGVRIKARIKFLQKRYKDATTEYERLVEEDQFYTYDVLKLAKCYEICGEYGRAQSFLESRIKIFPQNVHIRYKLALLVLNTRSTRASIPYLSTAIAVSPQNSDLLAQMGKVYHQLGNNRLSLYYLNRAIEGDPDNFELMRYRDILAGKSTAIQEFLTDDDITVLEKMSKPYKDEQVVTLLEEYAVSIMADGSHEKFVRKVFKINDSIAIDELRRQYIIFDPTTDRVDSIRCRVINNGNRLETTDSYDTSLSDPQSSLYYNLKAKVLQVPSLAEGSILDFSYRISSRAGNVYRGYYGEKFLIGGVYRIIKTNIVVLYPETKKLYFHWRRFPDPRSSTVKRGNTKILILKSHNIVPVKKETAMPDISKIAPVLYVSSHKNWQSIYNWYAALVRERMIVSDAIRNKVRDLVNKNDTPLEKVNKIYNFVNRKIRYVGFELGLGGIQPRSTYSTFRSEMGDCKDMSLLLTAMLREAGVRSYLVLVKTRDRGEVDRTVPHLGQFNHAVCYADIKGGIFLDPTAKLMSIHELPSDDRKVYAYIIKDRGYAFKKTGSGFYHKNFENADTVIELAGNGSAVLKRTLKKSGIFAQKARYDFLNIYQKLKKISEYWNETFTGARVSSVKIGSVEIDRPVEYSYRVDVPGFFSREKGFVILKSFLVTSDYYNQFAVTRKRKYPLIISSNWETRVKLTYVIPKGYTVIRLPESESYKRNKYRALFHYEKINERQIIVSSLISFSGKEISVEEYKDFRNFTLFVARKEHEQMVLQQINQGGK